MNTSTPKQVWTYRDNEPIPDETSPILGNIMSDPDYTNIPDSQETEPVRNETNVSGDMYNNKLTPRKVLSDLTVVRKGILWEVLRILVVRIGDPLAYLICLGIQLKTAYSTNMLLEEKNI